MSEPRTELAALTHALLCETRRRAWLGERRGAVALESEGGSTAAAPAAPVPRTPPDPRAEPQTAEALRSAPAEPREPGKTEAPAPTPTTPDGDAAERVRVRAAACTDLVELAAAVAGCTECGLCESRTQTVFADGNGAKRVLFVGEAPGFHEDREGVPFVGRAGALLTDIVEKGMGLARSDVYICNVLKCRPPENRDPTDEEKRVCTPWLDRQIELVDPAVVVALGRHAAGHLLASRSSLGRLRGQVHERDGRKVIATYHPAYLLRTPADKKECWKDVQLVMRVLGLPLPERK